MIVHPITMDFKLCWFLFVERKTGFYTEKGEHVAKVLLLVKKMFEDIFSKETVDLHSKLAVLYSIDEPAFYRSHNLIFLSSNDDLQHIYQFSHELCHVMVPDFVDLSFKWLEETFCQMMSWYILQQIYNNKDKYANHWLMKQCIKNPKYIEQDKERRDSLPAGSLPTYIQERLSHLQENCYDRPVNAAIAYEIYPLFEQNPKLWRTVLYLHRLQEGMRLREALSLLLTSADVEKEWADKLINRMCE